MPTDAIQTISDTQGDNLSLNMFPGAIGDGVTDCTAPVAAAFATAAANGGKLYIPRGVFIVDPTGLSANTALLTVGSRMRVYGEGTIKVKANCGDYFGLIGTTSDVTDLVIEGITIDQNVLANTSSTISVASASTTAQVAVGLFGSANGVTFRGLKIYASGINTLDVNGQGSTDVNFIDCKVYWQKRPSQTAFDNSAFYFDGGAPRAGVVNTSGAAVTWASGDVFLAAQVGRPMSIAGVNYVVLAFTDSHHITLSASAGTQTSVAYINPNAGKVFVRGCTWVADWNDGARTACELHYCSGKASGNSVKGYQGAHILDGVSDYVVSGNTGADLAFPCTIWAETGQTVMSVTVSDNVWSVNNADRSLGVAQGIGLEFASSGVDGDFENLNFHNNTLVFQKQNTTSGGAFLYSGISLVCQGNVTNARIHHNTIINAPIRGIKIGGAESAVQPVTHRRVFVEDNTIIDSGNNSDVSVAGYLGAIWATGDLEDCGIRRNQIHDTGTPRLSPRALNIDSTGGFTFTRVSIGANVPTTSDGSTFPNALVGAIQNDASIAFRTVTGPVTDTPTQSDYVLLADSTAGDIIVQFPVNLALGQILIVKKIAAANVVFIGTSTIDGESRSLINQNEMVSAQWDGTNWNSIVPTQMADVRNHIRSITSTVTAGVADNTILCDTTGGSIVVNLPASGNPTGQVITIKKTVSANAVNIGTSLVDGAALFIAAQYGYLTVQFDGTNWNLIGQDTLGKADHGAYAGTVSGSTCAVTI